ncbi:MAG: alpha-galactosidase [Anaerolineales bacterium]|nr:alpha-galactosidase [Anaerolineales bacterium]
MRAAPTTAPAAQTLPELLAGLGLPGHAALRPGPGFRLELGGRPAELERDPADPACYHLLGAGLTAQVVRQVFAELGVVTQQITLTNTGPAASPPLTALHVVWLPLDVQAAAAPYALSVGGGLTDGFYPPRAYRLDRVSFGQARDWEPPDPSFTRWWIGKRIYRLANDENGWSANPYLPLLLAGWQSAGGPVGLWAGLEWSARWELSFGTPQPDWRFTLWGGPRVKGAVLDPGESLSLPPVHVGVYGAAEQGGNAVRRYLSAAIAPDVEGERPHPVVAYHHWFGIEETLTDALLRQQADRAAELGVEYFEVDAGWYGGSSRNFADGVGNWERVDTAKFPAGLEPFADYVRSKGLRFGLWFEPERARRGSDWLAQHPDWYWDVGNPVNFMLDLTRRDVQDGLIAMLSGWIARLDIRWLRWDNNHPLGPSWDKVDPTGKVQFAYVAGLYRVRRELLERFPNLLIDNCAGGGNRIDFGVLRYAATMVISDHAEDPHICRLMQTGGARVLPANLMNSSFYVAADDPDQAIGPLELVSRMAGCLSLSGHIASWPAEKAALVKRYLAGYRSFRHLLMHDFYALTPYPRSEADWDVVQFVAPHTGEAVVLAYRVRGEVSGLVLPLGHLRPEGRYRVVDPFGLRPAETTPAAVLLSRGLSIVLGHDSAAVYHLLPE